jgi:hypothetical protein
MKSKFLLNYSKIEHHFECPFEHEDCELNAMGWERNCNYHTLIEKDYQDLPLLLVGELVDVYCMTFTIWKRVIDFDDDDGLMIYHLTYTAQ